MCCSFYGSPTEKKPKPLKVQEKVVIVRGNEAWMDTTFVLRSQDSVMVTAKGNFYNMIRDVRKLIENESLRRQMDERAKAFAQENFTPEKDTRKLEKFIPEKIEDNQK